MQKDPAYGVCPRCGGPVFRVSRRLIDRLTSVFRSVRRYRCDSHTCQWRGNLPVKPAASSSA